jgi:hypothetical protein
MDFHTDEPDTIRSKCLALIDKASSQLIGLDSLLFPTKTSDMARQLLLEALKALSTPSNLAPADPAVLYNRLFAFSDLADMVAKSATDRISWPLVSYCDQIWNGFFGDNGPRIFYSLTPLHNYTILPFSRRLEGNLSPLLPESVRKSIIAGPQIYCLQLASTEDYNLPLYANIGHEFGHAIFDVRRIEILNLLGTHVNPILARINTTLTTIDAGQAVRRYRRASKVVAAMAEEVFCDVAGAYLMGPAFFLSLYEISWGQERNVTQLSLFPEERFIRAYPSTAFRLDCVRRLARVDDFLRDATTEFAKFRNNALKSATDVIATVPSDHSSDKVMAFPRAEGDSEALQWAFALHLTELKQALQAFGADGDRAIRSWYVTDTKCDAREVAALVERLDAKLLPNIIPDKSTMGVCAPFIAILNAAAIYRLHLLSQGNVLKAEELSHRSRLVERLTEKALEVSFIQRRYKAWKESAHVGPKRP